MVLRFQVRVEMHPFCVCFGEGPNFLTRGEMVGSSFRRFLRQIAGCLAQNMAATGGPWEVAEACAGWSRSGSRHYILYIHTGSYMHVVTADFRKLLPSLFTSNPERQEVFSSTTIALLCPAPFGFVHCV